MVTAGAAHGHGWMDAAREVATDDAQLTSEGASALVEANPDGMIVVDETGAILIANRKVEELFGFDRADLVGQSVEILIPDRFRQPHTAHRTRYRAAPQERPMGAGLELYGRRGDGTEFPVEISLSPIATASGLRVIACIRDVTERKSIELERRRHERWLEALAAMREAFLQDRSRASVLPLICERARDLVGADGAVLLLRDGEGRLSVAARAGDVRGEMSGEEVLRTGRTMCIDEVRPGGGGPAVLAPLAADGAVLGVLAVAVAPEHGPFDAADRATIESFAKEAAIAMVLAAGRADRARLNVLEDRERIAADLHDRVIQRLFATGMGLQATAGRIGDEVVARRVEVAVGELDETITELRSAIFHLSERPEAEPFGERIHALAERYGAQLGFDPAVRLSGDVDDLPGAVLEQLVPTLEEALSNVARHARASAVTVELAVDDAEACLLVRDDGIGIGADAVPGTGLKTLRARAERLGGRCLVEAAPGGGTTVTWRVPL